MTEIWIVTSVGRDGVVRPSDENLRMEMARHDQEFRRRTADLPRWRQRVNRFVWGRPWGSWEAARRMMEGFDDG